MAMDDCRVSSVKLFGQVISLLPPSDHPAPANPEETTRDRIQDTAEQETADAKGEAEEKQPQPPKKPDKILPCPRCNSMDTKFCYYNNYNVNQPRYFCRDCQRYWTAGGSMRNVPVGAGRRKSKSSTERQLRHITISAVPQADAVLRSMAFLNDGVPADGGRIEFLPAEVPRAPAHDTAVGVVLPVQDPMAGVCQVHPFWVYQYWPPAVTASAAAGGQLGFHPYWGAGVQQSQPSAGLSAPSTSALGKHSRDDQSHTLERTTSKLDMVDMYETTEKPTGATERCLWAPKGLRIIDDADEVASSSVWVTLGMKKNKAGEITHGGLFSAFHPKMQKADPENPGSAAILAANPAAMARSLNFN